MEKEFVVLYTHQKQKKAKTWHDGSIKHSGHGTKGVLYDEKGARLDSIYIKIQDLTVGEQIESDRYLILIEELKKSALNQENVKPPVKEAPLSVPQKPQSQARCAGLKRKPTGFVPPRMVKQQFDIQNDNQQGNAINIENSQASNNYLKLLKSNFTDINPMNNNLAQRTKLSDRSAQYDPVQASPCATSSMHVSDSLKDQQTMLSMYSQFGQCQSSGESSQGSDCGTGAKLLSPWSVYGSNTSSPSLKLSQRSNTSSPSLKLSQSPNVHKSPGFLSNRKGDSQDFLIDRTTNKECSQSDKNISSHGLNSPKNDNYLKYLSQNGLPSPDVKCLKSSSQLEPSINSAGDRVAIEKLSNNVHTPIPMTCQASVRITEKNEVRSCDVEKNRDSYSEIKPKRSMTQILSLLRGKFKLENVETEYSNRIPKMMNEKSSIEEGEGKENNCQIDSQEKAIPKRQDDRMENNIESDQIASYNMKYCCNNISRCSLQSDQIENLVEETSNDKEFDNTSKPISRESVIRNDEKLNVMNASVLTTVNCSSQETVVKVTGKNSTPSLKSMESVDIEIEHDLHTKSLKISDVQSHSQAETKGLSYLEDSQLVESPKLSTCNFQENSPKLLSSCESQEKFLKLPSKCESQINSLSLLSSCESQINSPKFQPSCELQVKSTKMSYSYEIQVKSPKLTPSYEMHVNSQILPTRYEAQEKSLKLSSSCEPQDKFQALSSSVETQLKSNKLSSSCEPQLDDSFGDFSLTFSPECKVEDNDDDTDTCLYENGDAFVSEKVEQQEHPIINSEDKTQISDISQSPSTLQTSPGHKKTETGGRHKEEVTEDRQKKLPMQTLGHINGDQNMENKTHLTYSEVVKSQGKENTKLCPNCSHSFILCDCGDNDFCSSVKGHYGDNLINGINTHLIETKDSGDIESLKDKINRNCVSKKMFEDGDSQGTCMTVDTLDYSCDGADTQSLLSIEDIEKCPQDPVYVKNHDEQDLLYVRKVNTEEKRMVCDEKHLLYNSRRDVNNKINHIEPAVGYNTFRRNTVTAAFSNHQCSEVMNDYQSFDSHVTEADTHLPCDKSSQGNLILKQRSNEPDRMQGAIDFLHENDFVPKVCLDEEEDPLKRPADSHQCPDFKPGLTVEFTSKRKDVPDSKDMSAMISARLGGYKMAGSLSAVASRRLTHEINEDMPELQQKAGPICDGMVRTDGEDEIYSRLYQARLMYSPTDRDSSLPLVDNSPLVPTGYSGSEETSQLSDTLNSPFYSPRVPLGQKLMNCREEVICGEHDTEFPGHIDKRGMFNNRKMNSDENETQPRQNVCTRENKFTSRDNDRETHVIDIRRDFSSENEAQISQEMWRGENRRSIFNVMDRRRTQVERSSRDIRDLEIESSPDVSQKSIKSTNDVICKMKSKNSKWEEYIASDCSDEHEIDLKQYQSKKNASCCRDYSVIEKPEKIVDRLTQAQNKIAQYDAEIIDIQQTGAEQYKAEISGKQQTSQIRVECSEVLSAYNRHLEPNFTKPSTCENILEICEDHLPEHSKVQNCANTDGFIKSDLNVKSSHWDQNSELSINPSKPKQDLTPSFASTDSFDELFIQGDCDFDTGFEEIKEDNNKTHNDERLKYNKTDIVDNLNIPCKVTNIEKFGMMDDSQQNFSSHSHTSHINDTGDKSNRGCEKLPLFVDAKHSNVYLGAESDVNENPANDKDTDKTDSFGGLDESLQLSSPEFDRVGLKPEAKEVKLDKFKNTTSIRKETQPECKMKTTELNVVKSTENSPNFTSGSRCLRILSKMKIGQNLSSPNIDKVTEFKRTAFTDSDNISGTVDLSYISPQISPNENNANRKVTYLSHGKQPGFKDSINSQYKQVQQSSNRSSSRGGAFNSKFSAPAGRKGDIEETQNAQKSNMNKRFVAPSMVGSLTTQVSTQKARPGTSSLVSLRPDFGNTQGQSVSSSQLHFPCRSLIDQVQNVCRQVVIPERFPSVNIYKQVLTSALTEFINCQLREVAKRYYHALSRVDLTSFTAGTGGNAGRSSVPAGTPVCQCGAQSKMVMVKKQGANQGRYFYACNTSNRNQQCKFFQWADENSRGGQGKASSKRMIKDANGLNLFMKESRVHFYGESQLMIRTKDNIAKYFKAPKWVRNRGEADTIQKKQIVLKLPYKGHSSLYAKDDLWVVSKSIDFTAGSTFIARSTYHGPTSGQEVEIEPLVGYSPSNWPNNSLCHALLAGNASSELSCMENIREHIQPSSPPIVPQLLSRKNEEMVEKTSGRYQAPRMIPGRQKEFSVLLPCEQMDEISQTYIQQYHLNVDQAEAVRRVANMFSAEKNDQLDGILLIHGVFGAGKSYLLSVVVLFLVCVFDLLADISREDGCQWKLLISSTTNVAVDRILSGLLDLGFEDFIRVGSVKKIAKTVLPYSVHATGTDSQELRDLQEMLRSGELTAAEKNNVRKSIEKHRCGENKKKLSRVRVVGATCAACSLSCLNGMEFPLVLLDECSQMTEPTSLLPIARFSCRKLILVGDPKQLAPTIQSVEAAHNQGLEQTMFDRLLLMGHMPTLLRTQYRCHPHISALANNLFYGGMLENGVTENDRHPLVDFLPTLCVYSVENGQESCEGAGSYYNEEEAQFVVFLLQVLLSAGLEPAVLGVITLYRAQMARITDLLAVGGSDTDMKGIQVSTVDAFQGGERDVIILSCVRTQNCGFIDSDKRMNVALTRARHHLLIVGHHGNLSKSILWGKVINHCKEFENGLQSSEEARIVLQKCMEELDNQRVEAIESSASLPASGSCGVTRQKARGKKRKSTQEEPTGQSSPGDSDRRAVVNKRRKVPRKIVDKQTDEVSSKCDESSLETEGKETDLNTVVFKERQPSQCLPVIMPSPDFEVSDEEADMSLPSTCRSTVETHKQSKGSKHSERLKPLIFDSDSDSDLPAFSL